MTVTEAPLAPAAVLSGRRGRRSTGAGVVLAGAVVAVVALAVVLPGLFTGIDPDAGDLTATLAPPGPEHWLGTDQNGRDVLARIVHGARPSLLIGVGATLFALLGGTVVGTLAAQTGRWGDQVISRLLDVVLSVPGLLLVFLVAAVMGPGTAAAVVGLSVGMVPGFARVVRAEVLRVRSSAYVEAAVGLGRSRAAVVAAHVVPNAVGPVLGLATISLGAMIVAGSSLSFVGLGPQPPTAEWGAMLASGRELIGVAWWPTVFPGVAITVTVLAVSVLGQHLHRRFERRST